MLAAGDVLSSLVELVGGSGLIISMIAIAGDYQLLPLP